MANMTVAGAKSISNNSGLWHLLGTKDYGGLKASGTLTFNRWDSKSTAVSVGGSAYSNLVYSSGSGWSYRYHIKVALISGGNLYKVNNSSDGANHYVSGGNVILDKGWTSNYGSNSTMDFNDTIYISNNNETIYLCYWCGQEEGSSYDGCTAGYNGTSGRGHTVWVVVGSINSSNFPYNPYSEPSIGSLSITPAKGNHDETFTYNYSISKGTNDLSWVHLDAYYKSNNNLATWVNVGRNFGNRSDDLSGGLVANTKYYGKVVINDGKHTFYTNSVDFNTYTLPNSTASIGKDLFSPQDNVAYTWNSNNSSNVGDTFSTKVVMNSKDVSTNISGSITLDASTLNSYFTNAQRSISAMGGSISVTNTNKNSNKTHTTTKLFTVQYQPTQQPNQLTCSKSGTIIIQDTPTITVEWSYPNTAGAAGVVNGYKLRIYSDSGLTTQVGSDIDVPVTNAGSGASKTINTASQLKRGVTNYIKIVPYYNKPSGGIIEGTTYASMTLVKPISRINTPVISYPVNETKWHNRDFRVLLELPKDDDFEQIKSDYDLKSDSAYKYGCVEVTITANGKNYVYSTANDTKAAFSTTNMYHKRKIAIYPNYKGDLPASATTFKISIRVKKNYYDTSDTVAWSKPGTATVYVETVSRKTFVAGQTEIKQTHYDYVHQASKRLNSVYPITAVHSDNIYKNVGSQIDTKEYNGISSTIRAIQTNINNYCTYDNTNIKLNNTISALNGVKEFITANDIDNTISGRNYMNILVDDMNKLY